MGLKITDSKTGLFAAGVFVGTAGLKALKAAKVKKGAVKVVAEVLKGREALSDGLTVLKEHADDVYAEAKYLNEVEAEEKEEEELIFDEEEFMEIDDDEEFTEIEDEEEA